MRLVVAKLVIVFFLRPVVAGRIVLVFFLRLVVSRKIVFVFLRQVLARLIVVFFFSSAVYLIAELSFTESAVTVRVSVAWDYNQRRRGAAKSE